MKRNLKVLLFLSILYVVLIRLRPIWERNPGGHWNMLIYFLIAFIFLWVAVKVIIEIVRLIEQKKTLTLKLFFPQVILILLLLDGVLNPLKIDLDKIYGNVVFRACYEGTMNQATLKLRENGEFDIHWTGIFFSDDFFTGDYSKTGDTLILDFNTDVPRDLDDTLLIKGEYIYRIKPDTLLSTHFYLGNCKGLN